MKIKDGRGSFATVASLKLNNATVVNVSLHYQLIRRSSVHDLDDRRKYFASPAFDDRVDSVGSLFGSLQILL